MEDNRHKAIDMFIREHVIDNNSHINRILEAMQPMEELGGPERAEYIAIMNYLIADIEQRIVNAEAYAFTTKPKDII